MAITPCMAHAQIALNVRTISLAAAQEAALDQCRKNGFGVTVTLLDCRGRSKVMLHDGDANSHTSKQPAQGVYKSNTSLTTRVSFGEYDRRLTADPK